MFSLMKISTAACAFFAMQGASAKTDNNKLYFNTSMLSVFKPMDATNVSVATGYSAGAIAFTGWTADTPISAARYKAYSGSACTVFIGEAAASFSDFVPNTAQYTFDGEAMYSIFENAGNNMNAIQSFSVQYSGVGVGMSDTSGTNGPCPCYPITCGSGFYCTGTTTASNIQPLIDDQCSI